MGIFRKNPCKSFYDTKTHKFDFKGFSLSFESAVGKPATAKLASLNYQQIPPEISDRLRSQAEIHYQICNAIHSLPKDDPFKPELIKGFAAHLMEVEKTLIQLLEQQKKKPNQTGS